MRISVDLVCGAQAASNIRQSVCIIIDVLRASSTIITALAHGYEAVIPVKNLDALHPPDVCAGEHLGVHGLLTTFGNSPVELLNAPVTHPHLHLRTTNGTPCLLAIANTNEILIGALLNAKAVAQQAYQLAQTKLQHITLVCCGYHEVLEEDDYITASYIADYLAKMGARVTFKLKQQENMQEQILATPSAHRLIKLNSREDVIFCSIPDKYFVVPYYSHQVIKL